MDSRLKLIQRQFNRSAGGSYDTHANVQKRMAEALAARIRVWQQSAGNTAPIADILEIGCGTGALTENLLRAFPAAAITALDVASSMLEAARQRITSTHPSSQQQAEGRSPVSVIDSTGHVDWVLGDIETWSAEAAPGSFDLIISNACFQWLARPEETMHKLGRLLRPGGTLAFTTFGPDTFHELHQSFADAYHANGLPPQRHGLTFRSPGQWQTLLTETGFGGFVLERSVHSEYYATVREFLYSVKAVGASASEAAAPQGTPQRALFTDMFRAYEERFGSTAGVSATYDLILLQAKISTT